MAKRFFISVIIVFLGLGNAVLMHAHNSADTTTNRLLFIPNAFTPNNDGINDVFKVVNIEQEEIVYFKIFNKWGTVMYECQSNDAQWDGTYRGKAQESGDYGYVISVKYPQSSKIEVYKGVLALIND